MQGRHQHKTFASPIVTATPSAIYTPPAGAPSPTPATRKQRQSSGDQGAPKRTSDPLQCSKSHACHAKAAAEQRRPGSAKAYIRPPAVQQVPRLPRESSGRAAETKERQSVHQTPCSAASPTGDQGAPKRTSDPLQCSKSHACHAKAAAAQRRPRSAKAYIRPPAVQQVPRLPRESSVWCQSVWCQSVRRQSVWCQSVCRQSVRRQSVWHQSVWCQSVRCQSVWCQSVWRQSVWCQSVWRHSVWCQSVWRQSVWCQSVGFNLCDVNLCDVNLCDVNLCDVNRDGGGAEEARRRRVRRCQPKNKNPTQQCGEIAHSQYPPTFKEGVTPQSFLSPPAHGEVLRTGPHHPWPRDCTPPIAKSWLYIKDKVDMIDICDTVFASHVRLTWASSSEVLKYSQAVKRCLDALNLLVPPILQKLPDFRTVWKNQWRQSKKLLVRNSMAPRLYCENFRNGKELTPCLVHITTALKLRRHSDAVNLTPANRTSKNIISQPNISSCPIFSCIC